jgi:hypothetical protein
MDSPKKELENEMDLDNLGNLIVSHLELLMGAINNMTDQRCIDRVVANGEGAIITIDDGVTKQNWDIKPTKSNFDALGDDEDGCGPDGNYVDQ